MFHEIKIKKLIIVLIVLLNIVSYVKCVYKLEERYSWTQLDFQFPNQDLKQQALASGDYIPQNALPVGIEHWGNRLFVTVPRWKEGIPAALTYINTDHSLSGSPELIPYPDMRFNSLQGRCEDTIKTAYRIKADECGRLWVLDTGTLGIGNTTSNPCPYALNVFDLSTNTRIRRYVLRPEDTNTNTFIANIAVDVGKNCDDAHAYFSDELGYGLIVYSWEKNKSWRFSGHSFFFPDPLKGDFNVAGLNFQWGEEGIFGMALSSPRSDGSKVMYFSPLASHREFAVSTRTLQDESRVEESYHDFVFFEERGPNSHTTSRVMSDDGIMLFNLIDQNAVGCWHSSMPYAPRFHGIADKDDVGLVFPADIKIDENKNVWVISDRMPVFLITELDYNDVNFRIYTAPLSSLVEGTVCDLRGINSGSGYPSQNQINVPVPNQIIKQTPSLLGTGPQVFGTATISQVSPVDSRYKGYSIIPSVKNSYLPPLGRPEPPISVPQSKIPYSNIYATTQKAPNSFIPKAFIYNQHNGISLESEGPQHSYNPSGGLRHFQSLNKNGQTWQSTFWGGK